MANKRTFEIVIAGDESGAKKAMDHVQVHASAFGSAVTGAMFGMGQAVASGAINLAEKIGGIATGSITKLEGLATDTRKIMRETAMSAEDSSRLLTVAKESGVDAEALQKGFKGFDRILATHPEQIEKYGIKVRDLNGKMLPMTEIVANVSDKFKSLGDGYEGTALAQELFKKAGVDLMPLLQQGGASIRQLAAEADKYGLVLDEAGVKKGLAAKRATRELGMAWDGLQITLGQYVAPIFTTVVSWIGDKLPVAVAVAKIWLKEHEDGFKQVAAAAWVGFTWIWNNVPVVLGWVKGAAEKASEGLHKITDWWSQNVGTWQDFYRGMDEVKQTLGVMGDNASHLWEWLQLGSVIVYQKTGPAFEWLGGKLIWLKDHVLDPIAGFFQDLWGQLGPAFATLFSWVDPVVGAVQNLLSLLESAARFTSNPVGGFLSVFGLNPEENNRPRRATGGPVLAGGSYLVGERGPEVFTPGTSGHITPGVAGVQAGGGLTIIVNNAGSVMAERDLVRVIADGLQRQQLYSPLPVLAGVGT